MKEKSLTMESEKFSNVWVILAHGDTSQWWTCPCPWVYRLLVNFVPISYDRSSHMEIYWCYII